MLSYSLRQDGSGPLHWPLDRQLISLKPARFVPGEQSKVAIPPTKYELTVTEPFCGPTRVGHAPIVAEQNEHEIHDNIITIQYYLFPSIFCVNQYNDCMM